LLELLYTSKQTLGRRIQIWASRLQQRDLDCHARIVTLTDRGERIGQLVDGADQGRRSD